MTSKIKVDNINKVSDDSNIIKKCGTTTTIGSGASNPIVVDGSAVTLGRCGGTVALASGATQTGFGRTGTVDWQTTPKTGDFTAVNGEGYFVNTTSGAVVMTMPSGTAGAIVSIQDYNKTFDSNVLTITPASGQKINGGINDANLVISTEGQGLTFVYVDATVGWKTVHENDFTLGGSNFIIATGGTITEDGDYKVHTFTGPGTFQVTATGPAPAPATSACGTAKADYLVLAGGGGGAVDVYSATRGGGGGGAGGYRLSACTYSEPAGRANPCGALTLSVQSYSIAVGGGGASGSYPVPSCAAASGAQGVASTFSTITSAGGGGGQGHGPTGTGPMPQTSGGSGGGFQGEGTPTPTHPTGGKGNVPPTSPVQGFNAGNAAGAPNYSYGGGGGAGAVGGNAPSSAGGAGGVGSPGTITGSAVNYGGGGGSSPGGGASPCGTGGASGANNGTTNRGGGGGGTRNGASGNGGSGVVIIRYRFQ
jgi:hypothetical protein